MTQDYFDAKHTGGNRKTIEIEVDINTDRVMDFAHEIRDAVIESVLQTIDELAKEQEMWDGDIRALKKAIEGLRQ